MKYFYFFCLWLQIIEFQCTIPYGEKIVPFEVVSRSSDLFEYPKTENFQEILLDPKNFQLIVGARDNVFRLSLTGLHLLERLEWASNKSSIDACILKGQHEGSCRNFIKLIRNNGGKIFVCGTNAFSPVCTWRSDVKLSKIEAWENGAGRVPFNPTQASTGILSKNNALFVGLTLDFLGQDSAIIRSGGNLPWLRTNKADPKWLSNPSFIDSFETKNYVYFLFNEIAVETMGCDNNRLPRIARICKNDPGGVTVLRGTFLTYLKARLNCSVAAKIVGDSHFYYNLLKSVVYVESQQMIFALFSTQNNAVPGSAVCGFSIDSINEAFEADVFKYQPSRGHFWESVKEKPSNFRCENSLNNQFQSKYNQFIAENTQFSNRNLNTELNDRDKNTHYNTYSDVTIDKREKAKNVWSQNLEQTENEWSAYSKESRHDQAMKAHKYQLLDHSVEAVNNRPIVVEHNMRFTHIAVDEIRHSNMGKLFIIFAATGHGQIKKFSVFENHFRHKKDGTPTLNSCFLNTIIPFKTNEPTILSLKLLKETKSLYIGTNTEVKRISVAFCDVHISQSACLEARDPYCGWDTFAEKCTETPEEVSVGTSGVRWKQLSGCPNELRAVDGAWAPWSEWTKCNKIDTNEPCQCRNRQCSAPAPKRGGIPCFGPKTEITNCTIHGDWTEWSAWSSCSSSCGFGMKSRRRSCTNPSPKNRGRICIGPEIDEQYCHNLPKCPRRVSSVDGGWSEWAKWSECSKNCGKGIRKRFRTCSQPTPKLGGAECSGCDSQVEECVDRNCNQVEVTDLENFSEWTEWIRTVGENNNNGYKNTGKIRDKITAAAVNEISREDINYSKNVGKNNKENFYLERRFRAKCSIKLSSEGESKDFEGNLENENRFCSQSSCSQSYEMKYLHADKHFSTPLNNEVPETSYSDEVINNVPSRSGNIENNLGYQSSQGYSQKESNDTWTEWSECNVPCDGGFKQRICKGECHSGKKDKENCNEFPCSSKFSTPKNNCISSGIILGACLTCLVLGSISGAIAMYIWIKNPLKKTKCTSVEKSANEDVDNGPHLVPIWSKNTKNTDKNIGSSSLNCQSFSTPNQYVSVPKIASTISENSSKLDASSYESYGPYDSLALKDLRQYKLPSRDWRISTSETQSPIDNNPLSHNISLNLRDYTSPLKEDSSLLRDYNRATIKRFASSRPDFLKDFRSSDGLQNDCLRPDFYSDIPKTNLYPEKMYFT